MVKKVFRQDNLFFFVYIDNIVNGAMYNTYILVLRSTTHIPISIFDYY